MTHCSAHHAPKGNGNASKLLIIGVLLTLIFSGIEALAGYWAHSLALLSDAGHMLSDSLALGLAAIAAHISRAPPTCEHSYGLGRAEVLAAWVSSLFMVGISLGIVYEAMHRLHAPLQVHGPMVTVVAAIGLVINLLLAWLLHRGEKTLNTRAALLHVLGDLLGSVAALVAGLVISWTQWSLIDPLLSILIAVLILFASLHLCRETLAVLMEAVPKHLDLNTVGTSMAQLPHVVNVHDLHIWSLSSGQIILTAHIQIANMQNWAWVLNKLKAHLKDQYQIEHATLQPESDAIVMQRA